VEVVVAGDVFQQLGGSADAVGSCFMQNIQRDLGVDQQGGDVAVVTGEGHIALLGRCAITWVGCHGVDAGSS
jgi:hypothetical protein